jgi:hypothetical protein
MMKDNSEFDALGALFRQKLEGHRIPVPDNDWDEIERRLHKPARKAFVWLCRGGAVAAAAIIVALLLPNRPPFDGTADTAISPQITLTTPQHEISDETATIDHEAISMTSQQETAHTSPSNIA